MSAFRHAALAALLIVIASLAFVPGLRGPFLLDDLSSIPKARPGALSNEEAIDIAARNRAGLLRRPISSLSFTLNHVVERDAPYSFKVTNLILHVFVGFAVAYLARLVLLWLLPHWPPWRRDLSALTAALLFTAHPLQVSTVLYVVQRMALLATLFTVGGLIFLARYLDRAARSGDRVDIAPFVLAAAGYWACFALAVGSKESGVLLPLLAVVVMFAASWAGRIGTAGRRFAVHAIVLPLAIGLVAVPFAWEAMFASYGARDFTLLERLATEATVLWFYLGLYLVPMVKRMGLYHDDYPIFNFGDPIVWLAIAGLAALVIAAIFLWRRVPLFGFAVAWYLASHALESTVLPLELVFEHRNYLALIGPTIAIGALLGTLFAAKGRLLRATPFILVAVLGLGTVHRSAIWSSDERFHAAELANHPGSARAQLRAASLASARGDIEASRQHVEAVKRAVPGAAWPWLLDAHLACSIPDEPVDWSRIELALTRRATISQQDVGALIALVKRLLPPSTCTRLDDEALDRVLVAGIERATVTGEMDRAQTFFVLRSYIARGRGNYHHAVQWMRAAAATGTSAAEVLSDLAFYQLNEGRYDDCADTIAALRAVAASEKLPIGYRIEELEEALNHARTTASSRGGT